MTPVEIAGKLIDSYPAWVSLVLIVLLGTQRKALAGFIGRVTKVETPTGSIAAGTSSDEQKNLPATAAASTDPRKVADEMLKGLDNPYIALTRSQIEHDLTSRGLDDENMRRVMLQYTTTALVMADFERLDNLIWGSQIQMIQDLNASGAVRVDALRPYYEHGKAKFSDAYVNYTFEQWVGFLVSASLLYREADGVGVRVTPKGQAFLMFLAHNARPFTRPY